MERALWHPSGAQNFEMAIRFLENVWNTELYLCYPVCLYGMHRDSLFYVRLLSCGRQLTSKGLHRRYIEVLLLKSQLFYFPYIYFLGGGGLERNMRFLYCGRVPAANAPGCTAAEGLLYKP